MSLVTVNCSTMSNTSANLLFPGKSSPAFPVFSRCMVVVIVLVSGLLLATTSMADNSSRYFNEGIKASIAGDYNTALQHFKKARQAGLNTSVLDYNLAVSYYKLQQYESSRQTFSKLTDTPTFEQLAYFNLGLIANKQKDEATAIRWFQRAYRNRSNEKLRKLAALALQRLGVSARKTRRSVPDWTGSVSSALARDSNVSLVNEELAGVTGESDTAVNLSTTAGRWLKGNVNSGVRLKLSAVMRKYGKLSQNNDSQLSARILRYDQLGEWKVRLGGSWDEIYFNGSEYQRVVSADVRVRAALSLASQFHFRYKLSRVQATDAVFDYLDGWRQQFRVGLQHKYTAGKTRYYYQLELNNREDRLGITNPFTRYSPTRHTLRITHWRDIASHWRLRLDGRFRFSDYNDDNILAGNVSERRIDGQWRITTRMSRTFGRRWEVFVQHGLTKNNSSIDLENFSKSYQRSILKVGVNWFF